ncbi:MAG: DUF3800 domain-containing protein [Oceanicaulis sp.]
MKRSDFIVYVDETGDHGMEKINPTAPVFALCAVLYKTSEYLEGDLPSLTRLKFDLWGHDAVVLHNRSIRRKVKPFQACKDPQKRDLLYSRIAQFFGDSKCAIVCAAVYRPRHRAAYAEPENPYALTVRFVLERVFGAVQGHGGANRITDFIFESRGDEEDKQVRSWFARACEGHNKWGRKLPFRLHFAPKFTNMVGLQVADLAAYPIAKHVEAPDVQRPDWDAVEPRIRRSATGEILGWGLKIFP